MTTVHPHEKLKKPQEQLTDAHATTHMIVIIGHTAMSEIRGAPVVKDTHHVATTEDLTAISPMMIGMILQNTEDMIVRGMIRITTCALTLMMITTKNDGRPGSIVEAEIIKIIETVTLGKIMDDTIVTIGKVTGNMIMMKMTDMPALEGMLLTASLQEGDMNVKVETTQPPSTSWLMPWEGSCAGTDSGYK